MAETTALYAAALEQLAGISILCDASMRVVALTEGCEPLLGHPVKLGDSAIATLCGDREEKPIAQALAKGQAAKGKIVRFRSHIDENTKRKQMHSVSIEVAATPLFADASAQRAASTRPIGWLLRLAAADVEPADSDITKALGTPRNKPDETIVFHGMVTADPAMKRMFHVLERAAKRNVAVLVRGPSGAGKELVAQALHALSHRAQGPFRAINCAALPPDLLESELFGHVKGAFTGAVKDHLGIFRAAHGGTLFLDEIAEMPLPLQAKLLRVLETKSVLPVGATATIPVDVRIVSATHQGLREAVKQGKFRADLMFRLRVVPIFIPALRERPADIPLLLRLFMAELNKTGLSEGHRVIDKIAPTALARLTSYHWPGNVRELRNVLEYAYVIGEGATLTEADLPPELFEPIGADRFEALVSQGDSSPHANPIVDALARANGNRERAAAMLGISRVTLWRRMAALGLAESR